MKGKKDGIMLRGGHPAWRDYRIVVAVIVGVTCGIIWAYCRPHGGFMSKTAYAHNTVEGKAGYVVSNAWAAPVVDATVQVLEAKVASLEAEVKRLQKERNAAQSQVEALAPATKAGLQGTVKSVRTNPAVLPDISVNPALAKLLEKVAVNKELIVGISNNNVRNMLKVWFESIQRVGVTNYLVIALDDDIAEFCRDHKVPYYRRDAAISKAQANTGDNHAISGLKFHLLREFLVLGYSVFLSDVDVVYLQNPFPHLERDCDVEGMTDGHDNQTAYGYDDVMDDPSMGWSRYAHTMRIWVFNSGLFYIRPTVPSIELLDRITDRLSRETAWDQAVFNEELFYPSHPGYTGLHASRRVLDYLLFLNSKVLFKILRKEPYSVDHKPVTIHVNYHPDKFERMVAIVEYYVKGNTEALKRFPDGSEW